MRGLLRPLFPQFARLESTLSSPSTPQAAPDLTDEEMQQMNPLAALLRSLLPWVNLGQAPAEDEGGEGEGGAAGAGAGQQQQPPGAG